jgi:hypothetical protein
MENVSFVVVGVDAANFPPRQFSTAFWEISPESVADAVAGAVAAAYEALGYGGIEIRIVPITA